MLIIDLSVQSLLNSWTFSVQPTAAQSWRGRARNFFKYLEKHNFYLTPLNAANGLPDFRCYIAAIYHAKGSSFLGAKRPLYISLSICRYVRCCSPMNSYRSSEHQEVYVYVDFLRSTK